MQLLVVLSIALFVVSPATGRGWSASYLNIARKATLPDLYEASVLELQAGLNSGVFSSVDLVKVRPFLVYSLWTCFTSSCVK